MAIPETVCRVHLCSSCENIPKNPEENFYATLPSGAIYNSSSRHLVSGRVPCVLQEVFVCIHTMLGPFSIGFIQREDSDMEHLANSRFVMRFSLPRLVSPTAVRNLSAAVDVVTQQASAMLSVPTYRRLTVWHFNFEVARS